MLSAAPKRLSNIRNRRKKTSRFGGRQEAWKFMGAHNRDFSFGALISLPFLFLIIFVPKTHSKIIEKMGTKINRKE